MLGRSIETKSTAVKASLLIAGSLMSVAAAVAIVMTQAGADTRLQQHADAATLAGVDALVATAALPDAQRIDASIAAVTTTLAEGGLKVQSVAASLDTMSVQVTVDAPSQGTPVVSVAHYVRPGESLAPLRSSHLAPSRTPARL